jgi:hypothetical protein
VGWGEFTNPDRHLWRKAWVTRDPHASREKVWPRPLLAFWASQSDRPGELSSGSCYLYDGVAITHYAVAWSLTV